MVTRDVFQLELEKRSVVQSEVNPVTGGIVKLTAGSSLPIYLGEFFNFSATNLTKWRKALGRARSGGTPAKVALIGDSTTRGAGSNGSPSVNVIGNSYPTALSGILNKIFANTQANSWWGDGTFGVPISTLDTRIALSGGFASSAVNSLGGKALSTSTAGTITFTPTAPCRYFDVWYIKSSGNGIFSLDVGGVGTTNFDTGSGGIGFAKATIDAGSATLSPLNIKYVSGNVFFIVGAEGYQSTDQIYLRNMGRSGSKVSDWTLSTSSPWDSLTALQTVASDLSIIDLTINDAAQSTDIATYTAGMQSIINAALATGDVILMVGVPTSTSVSSQVNQDACRIAYYSLAASNNLPLIDLTLRFGTYSAANAQGLFYDNYHPNAIGYSDVASSVAKALSIVCN